MPNRLQYETSPYLLQHKDNPIDWFAWGDDAFEKARAEAKPVLLSVGYSACHWCHVMAHESFEHEQTAQILNEGFVCIKVDREERPDIDDIYMQAVQSLTGQGGWPMTVFLMPDGRPFYGGTYFPLEPRHGLPSFRQVLSAIQDAWTNRRDQITEAAAGITESLDRSELGIGGSESDISAGLLNEAIKQLAQSFDATHGGFSGAPKFPQPMNLAFSLRSYARTGDPHTLHMVTHTLEKMARGGIYDQIGGGFARYSVDHLWLVPHFEKMLYDNAQLSRLYLHAWQITRDDFLRRIAEETYDYVLRELTAPEGGFYCATDADSATADGHLEEGAFFVWTIAEVQALLNEEDAKIAIEYFGMSHGGNFEGANILHVPQNDAIAADNLNLSVDALRERLAIIKDALYAARTHRAHPALDDKILTAWNGLMLTSLAEAARVLDREDYRWAAVRAGEFLLEAMVTPEYRVYRSHKNGESKLNGYLEDYAALIEAFLALYQTTFDEKWFTTAQRLAETVLTHFPAPEGGFFDTSDDHEALIVRPRNVQDNATPSGSGKMAQVLVTLSAYTGDARYEDAARQTLRLLTNAIRQYPQAFGEYAGAMEMLVAGVQEIAIVGDATEAAPLVDTVIKAYHPNSVIAFAPHSIEGEHPAIPLLSYRKQRDGQATAYVCRQFTCLQPVTTPDALKALLDQA